MAVILRWVPPDVDSNFDQVRIYRDTSETGGFLTVTYTVSAKVDHYFDADGTSGHWYKISFYDTDSGEESALSDAMQGGTFAGYCTPDDVYDFTDIKQKQVITQDMNKYIELASAQLNEDIQVRVDKEIVSQIDNVKKNTQDGSNTTFYTRQFPIGDLTGNREVTVDDLEVYSVDSSGVRTQLTVSSITPNTGEFVLSAAPSSAVRLELKYVYAPVSVSTPHPLVRMAVIALSAAYAFSKINVGKPKSVKFGTVTMLRHMESFDHWYRRYEQTVFRINNRMADKVDVNTNNFEPIWGEAYY